MRPGIRTTDTRPHFFLRANSSSGVGRPDSCAEVGVGEALLLPHSHRFVQSELQIEITLGLIAVQSAESKFDDLITAF